MPTIGGKLSYLVYIVSLRINRVVANLKIWKREKKPEQSQLQTENVPVITEGTPGPAVEPSTDVAATPETSETFKEHYPLLASLFICRNC